MNDSGYKMLQHKMLKQWRATIVFCLAGAAALLGAAAQAAATEPAPPVGHAFYDRDAPVESVPCTEAQKAFQTVAGHALLAKINSALAAGAHVFTVPPGVYRLAHGIGLGDSQGFQLNAAGCTFILVNTDAAFVSGGDCTDIAIIGPMTIDHAPYGLSQAIITASDMDTGVVKVRIMPGYSTDISAKGIGTLYKPDGTQIMLPSWGSYSGVKAENAAGRLFRLVPPKGTAGLFAVGNLVSLPVNAGVSPVAFAFKSLHNVRLQDIQLGSGGPLLTGGQSGDSRFLRIKNGPLPGTSRLASGSSMQSWNSGGTVLFDGCEFGSSTDDLMDFQGSGLHMFYRTQPDNPRQIVVWNWFGGIGFGQGDRITLYDPKSFNTVAHATVVSAVPLTDEAVRKEANHLADVDNTFHLQRGGQSLTLVTLDAPLAATPGDLLENVSGRVKSFTITRCRFHDSAVRVMVEGFSKGTFTDNTFERVNGGLSLATDVWWPQGGAMENILVRGNVFKDSPYNTGWGSEGASLNIGPLWNHAPLKAGEGYANKNILITGNHFHGSAQAAVSVADAADVTITGNVIDGALTSDGRGAVVLDVVGNADVSGNTVLHCKGPVVYIYHSQGVRAARNFLNGRLAPASAVESVNSTGVTVASASLGHAHK